MDKNFTIIWLYEYINRYIDKDMDNIIMWIILWITQFFYVDKVRSAVDKIA